MKEFDEKKPYLRVYGWPGAHYEQDGILYDAAGKSCTTQEAPEPIDGEPEVVVLKAPSPPKPVDTTLVERVRTVTIPELGTTTEPLEEESPLIVSADAEKEKRRLATSERMKAHWAEKRAKDADNVEG